MFPADELESFKKWVGEIYRFKLLYRETMFGSLPFTPNLYQETLCWLNKKSYNSPITRGIRWLTSALHIHSNLEIWQLKRSQIMYHGFFGDLLSRSHLLISTRCTICIIHVLHFLTWQPSRGGSRNFITVFRDLPWCRFQRWLIIRVRGARSPPLHQLMK